MRYLMLASAENPSIDFIELNDFNGYLCTQFQTVGIARKLEHLSIKNRQTAVTNKTEFKKYSLVIEILTTYAMYEQKYEEFEEFLDRNKLTGFILYYKPYEGRELRHIFCDIETTAKTEKLQPITLTVIQNSLWLSELSSASTSASTSNSNSDNLFEFGQETINGENYYCASFLEDTEIDNYYCIVFSSNTQTTAEFSINGYNEVPLTIRIEGECINPVLYIYKKGESEPLKQVQIFAEIDKNYYVEINSDIFNNGIWLKNNTTGTNIDYTELVNNAFGSPYIFLKHGTYTMRLAHEGEAQAIASIFWNEEFSG